MPAATAVDKRILDIHDYLLAEPEDISLAGIGKALGISVGQTSIALNRGMKKGYFGRRRRIHFGSQYEYYALEVPEEIYEKDDDAEQFTIYARCKNCGELKELMLADSQHAVEALYYRTAWDCDGCGLYVRGSDAFTLREFANARGNRHADRYRDDSVSNPRVVVGKAE